MSWLARLLHRRAGSTLSGLAFIAVGERVDAQVLIYQHNQAVRHIEQLHIQVDSLIEEQRRLASRADRLEGRPDSTFGNTREELGMLA